MRAIWSGLARFGGCSRRHSGSQPHAAPPSGHSGGWGSRHVGRHSRPAPAGAGRRACGGKGQRTQHWVDGAPFHKGAATATTEHQPTGGFVASVATLSVRVHNAHQAWLWAAQMHAAGEAPPLRAGPRPPPLQSRPRSAGGSGAPCMGTQEHPGEGCCSSHPTAC